MTVKEIKQKNEKVNETASILDLLRMGFIEYGMLYNGRS
jgi:hypothetical protein